MAGIDTVDVALSLLKIAIVVGALLNVTPIMVWVERRGSALIQDRVGPNRVGPFGLFQSLADAAKFFLKEDIIPLDANKWLYTLAPMFGLIPALTTIAVVPWGRPFVLRSGRVFEPIVADLNVGILLIFAMALAAISALMVAGSLRLTDVVWKQTGYFVLFDTIKLPAWNIFSPAMWFAFIVFTVASFAETNRLPFDFAEAEAELVAGYHTEYSSMKFALFFMSEYIAMATVSAVVVTLFFGGWDIPYYNEPPTFLGFLLSAIFFVIKVSILMFIFVWVRWTITRLKYDILMRLGWKVLLPLAVVNIVLVAFFIAKRWI